YTLDYLPQHHRSDAFSGLRQHHPELINDDIMCCEHSRLGTSIPVVKLHRLTQGCGSLEVGNLDSPTIARVSPSGTQVKDEIPGGNLLRHRSVDIHPKHHRSSSGNTGAPIDHPDSDAEGVEQHSR